MQELHPDRYSNFNDNKSFLAFLDCLHAPDLANWKHWEVKIKGNVPDPRRPGSFLTETLDLWGHDPLEAVCSLLSNPTFKEHLSYAPVKEYMGSEEEGDELWSEMHTGEKWWRLQVRQ